MRLVRALVNWLIFLSIPIWLLPFLCSAMLFDKSARHDWNSWATGKVWVWKA